MTEYEVIEKLKRLLSAGEVYHVTYYQAVRTAKDGTIQEVEIEVLDRGPEDPHTRYHVTAVAKDGRAASGNSGASLDTVLATVHWYKLDRIMNIEESGSAVN